jgi:hypothetical protein
MKIFMIYEWMDQATNRWMNKWTMWLYVRNTHLVTFNMEKLNNCGTSWHVYGSWWMKWCEIEWNIVYENEEFYNIMSFKVEAKCKRTPKKRP